MKLRLLFLLVTFIVMSMALAKSAANRQSGFSPKNKCIHPTEYYFFLNQVKKKILVCDYENKSISRKCMLEKDKCPFLQAPLHSDSNFDRNTQLSPGAKKCLQLKGSLVYGSVDQSADLQECICLKDSYEALCSSLIYSEEDSTED